MLVTKDVLVCERYQGDPKNKELFEDYKKKFIANSKSA